MAALRMIPGLGELLEKTSLVVQGDVPAVKGESGLQRLRRRYKNACLNTFDAYGSHTYQHHKRDDEIRALVKELQADESKVLNQDKYFSRPTPIGCALRILK
jgi:hypothetical protein